MKDSRSVRWAQSLADALKEWCLENGYDRGKLALELGIEARVWDTIRRGRSISQKVNAYAKIHFWSDLPEADPREIPPRIIPLPKPVGGSAEKTRAWTQADYNRWLKSPEGRSLAAKKEEKWPSAASETELATSEEVAEIETTPIPLFGPSSTLGMFLGVQVDVWLNLLADQLVRRFTPEVEALFERKLAEAFQAQPIGGRAKTSGRANANQLAKDLLEALQPAIEGSSADRDRWIAENRKVVAQLLPLLDVLTQPPDKREHALGTFKGGS